jgi:hypothetical protein
MNDLIKKLAEQATEYATTRHPLSNHIVLSVNSEKFEEKFAELIVQECLVVINQSNGVGDDDVIKISQDVKKHFGVE